LTFFFFIELSLQIADSPLPIVRSYSFLVSEGSLPVPTVPGFPHFCGRSLRFSYLYISSFFCLIWLSDGAEPASLFFFPFWKKPFPVLQTPPFSRERFLGSFELSLQFPVSMGRTTPGILFVAPGTPGPKLSPPYDASHLFCRAFF